MSEWAKMDLGELVNLRLINQLIVRNELTNPRDVAGRMGAIQAQDFGMAKWAIGLRLQNTTDRQVETAIDHGEIIRTHVLRSTWHFVSSDDVYWMLELSSPHIKASLQTRHKQLGLSESVLSKSNQIIDNALRNGGHLTREELLLELGKAKIPLTENRASHLLVWAELEGIISSGPMKRGKPTYTILEEWVPKKKRVTQEEAMSNLARKYFSSHGPATLNDFVWWSGLPVNKARQALESISSEYISVEIDHHTYWFAEINSIPSIETEDLHLLPAFDEFLISYEDRSAVFPFEDFNKTVSNNGIFRPIIVLNGQVVGIWKRTIKKDKVIIEMEFFNRSGNLTLNRIEEVLTRYGHFLDKQIEINPPF